MPDAAKAIERCGVADPASPHRRFSVVLIKTSHYDDNGYVVRAFRSSMPANSLATVYALVADCAARHNSTYFSRTYGLRLSAKLSGSCTTRMTSSTSARSLRR